MKSNIMLSLATIAVLAATAQAAQYNTESTTNWVSVTAASASIPSGDTASWAIPSSGTASRTGSYIDTDTEVGDPLKYLLSDVSALGPMTIRITGQIQDIVLHAGEPAVYTGTGIPQASIGATDSAWYAWHCTATSPSETGAWVEMTGTAPAENDDPVVTIEFKDGYVRYGIGSTPTWLTHTEGSVTDASGWMSNAKTFTDIDAIGLAGYGHFGNINGFAVKTITINTGNAKLAEAITANKFDIGTGGANLDEAADGATLTRRQAIILGMDSEKTKPFVAPVQTGGDNSGKLGFKIGNANPGKYGTDAYTTFEVYECDSPSDAGTLKASADAADTAYVTTPEAGAGVKYYKIKIKFQ